MRFLKIAIVLLMLGQAVSAQQQQQQQEKKPTLTQLLLQAKTEVMQQELVLTNQQMEQFRPLYANYEKEVSKASATVRKAKLKEHDPKAGPLQITQEEALAQITAMFDASQGILDVKKRFMGDFATILSPSQLIQFYRTESAIRTRVYREVTARQKEEEARKSTQPTP